MRTLPNNLEAEETMIGCLLLEPTAMETLSEIGFVAEAFYLNKTRIVFEAAQWLHSRQQHCDLITISSRLSDTSQLEAIGGLEYLAQCAERTVSAVNLDRYADLVMRKWKRRELIKAMDKALEAAYNPAIDDEEVWNDLEKFVTEAVTGRQNKGLKHISDILPEIWQDLESGKEPGISLGLNYLDQCLGGGLLPGELYVIAGRPGMGKTTVGQFVARAIARYKMPVAFFSCEMEEKQVVLRMLATEAQVNHTALMANRFPDESAHALTNAYVELVDLPLYFDDTPGSQITMRHIASQCTRIYRKHGSLGLIVLDYLQLIGDQAAGNRVNEIGKYTAQLKSFAKQFHCPVIALSQLSRQVESRNDKRPVMSDIRDSGCIEQDAGVVLFLYRDEYYNPDTQDKGILKIIIGKNRHGATGTVKTLFTPETGKIENFKAY